MRTPYKFNIYHANGKGNGSALSLELYHASEVNIGKVILSISLQKSTGSREGSKPVFSSFDWADRIAVRLEAAEVEQMLEVFAGETEAINNGKGLVYVEGGVSTTFCIRHSVEPVPRYIIEIVKRDGEETKKRLIALTPTEAGMLYHGLSYSMGAIMFG